MVKVGIDILLGVQLAFLIELSELLEILGERLALQDLSSARHPWMIQRVLGRDALVGIHGEKRLDEILGIGRYSIPQFWVHDVATLANLVKGLSDCLLKEGRVSTKNHEENDSNGPIVSSFVIGYIVDDLWCNISW